MGIIVTKTVKIILAWTGFHDIGTYTNKSL